MSGKSERFLLDTNAVVALLQGNTAAAHQLQNVEWVGISIISQLEFLAFPALSESDVTFFRLFLQRINVIGLTPQAEAHINAITRVRQQYRLKLPDAIIAATALEWNAVLVTADKQFQVVTELSVLDFTAPEEHPD